MKKTMFLFVLLAISSVSNGQVNYISVFEKLSVADTIYTTEQVEAIKKENQVEHNQGFIYTVEDKDNTISLCLLKKEEKFWIAFYIDSYGKDSFEVKSISKNNRYLFITKEINNSSRQTEVVSRSCLIIDLQTNSFLELGYYNYVHYWEYKDDSEVQVSTKKIEQSSIIIDDNFITKIINCYENNENIKCPDTGGLYELQGTILKKIKYYDPDAMDLKPVHYFGKLAIGMTLEDVKEVYTDVNFVEKENLYATRKEEYNKGFEVWDGSNLLGFATNDVSEQKINRFIVLSPAFDFGAININTTAGEVLRLYPNAIIRIDLLTEWEHIYIEDLKIELVFQTDESNRMGIYSDESFLTIRNSNAKIDFIVVE